MKTLLTMLLFVSLPCFAQDAAVPTPTPTPTSTPPLTPPPTPTPTMAPCSSEQYRQFDFWIGEWNVTMNGQAAGRNSIRPIHNGCVLNENWQGAGGSSGSSYNVYDQGTGRWHQTWVDGAGTLLQLDGGLMDGSMVLKGEQPSSSGSGKTTHRITWTPNADGTVRQLWDSSEDGVTWTVLFDGLYEKAAAD